MVFGGAEGKKNLILYFDCVRIFGGFVFFVYRTSQALSRSISTSASKQKVMDEAQEILLRSLENEGVSLPNGVSSIQDLTPDSLVSICSQSLSRIDSSPSSFPTSLPSSVAERFKICTEIAFAIKTLGYAGDLSFHQVPALFSSFFFHIDLCMCVGKFILPC